MSEPAIILAAAPSPAPAIVEAVAPVAAIASPTEGTFNTAELAAIEAASSGKPVAPAAGKPADYAPAVGITPAEPVAAPAAGEVPAVAPAAVPTPAPVDDGDGDPLDSIKGIKIKPQNFQDMEVLRLMKPRGGAPGLNLPEAYAKVYGAPVAPAAPKAEAVLAPAALIPDAELTAIDAEIITLTTAAEKAADDMNTKEAMRLNREIDAKARQRERIEANREAHTKATETAKATEAETNFRQKEIASAQKVYAADPQLADKASPRRQEFDAFVQIWATDPSNKDEVNSPRWSEHAYRDFVEAKGPGKAAAPATVPALPAPTPGAAAAPRVTAATVLTPGETPSGASALTPTQLLASLDGMSVDQLRALLPKR